ncbi:MAG: MBL fold metallo-hydrolase [Acidobacteria bacterium]|nr:MBL fold metallo-hydrolase [Acidobacteriota bacterium]
MKRILCLAFILGLAMISSSAERQNAGNSPAGFDEELHAVIIGSGSPQYDPDRAGPSVLIRYKNQNILVDMGNGTQANLEKLGLNFRELNGLLITHHHLDHTEEFIPVFIKTLLGGNKFEVVGPAPTKEYVESINSIYKKDIDYRLGRRGGRDYSSVKDNFNVKELEGGESFSIGEIEISTTAVNHTIETIAYRFQAGGRSIVISGDLTYSESLPKLAKNADVLIIDSGAVVRNEGSNNRPNRRGNGNGQGRRQGQQGGQRAHSSLEEVGKMARDSNVKTLIMTHLPNVAIDEEATRIEVAKNFKGEIVFAKDLLEIDPK